MYDGSWRGCEVHRFEDRWQVLGLWLFWYTGMLCVRVLVRSGVDVRRVCFLMTMGAQIYRRRHVVAVCNVYVITP